MGAANTSCLFMLSIWGCCIPFDRLSRHVRLLAEGKGGTKGRGDQSAAVPLPVYTLSAHVAVTALDGDSLPKLARHAM